jgi:hypothetical protein
MIDYRFLALVSVVLLWLTRKLLSLRAHVTVAKEVGVPYGIARELPNCVFISEGNYLPLVSLERHRWIFLDSNSRPHSPSPQGITFLSRLAMGNVCN